MFKINRDAHSLAATTDQKIAGYFFCFSALCIPISLALQNVGFVLLCLFALLSSFISFSNKLRYIFDNPATKWLLLFYLWIVIGLFYSDATLSWKYKVFGEQSYLIGFVLLLSLSYKAPITRLLSIVNFYVIGCIFVVVVGFLGKASLLPTINWFQHPAPYYMFFKIYGAMFMAMGGYIALQLTLSQQLKKSKCFYGFCFIAITYNIFWMSLSRSGYVLYILLLLLSVFQAKKRKFKYGLLLLIIVILGVVAFTSRNYKVGVTRIQSNSILALKSDKVDSSTGIRIQYFKNSLKLWKAHPLLGSGTGGFLQQYIDIHGITAAGDIATTKQPQVSPENSYAFILVEHGLIGIFLLLGLYFSQIKCCFVINNAIQRNLAQGFMLLIVIAGFSQNMLLGNSPLVFYLFFSTVLFTNYHKNHKTGVM